MCLIQLSTLSLNCYYSYKVFMCACVCIYMCVCVYIYVCVCVSPARVHGFIDNTR